MQKPLERSHWNLWVGQVFLGIVRAELFIVGLESALLNFLLHVEASDKLVSLFNISSVLDQSIDKLFLRFHILLLHLLLVVLIVFQVHFLNHGPDLLLNDLLLFELLDLLHNGCSGLDRRLLVSLSLPGGRASSFRVLVWFFCLEPLGLLVCHRLVLLGHCLRRCLRLFDDHLLRWTLLQVILEYLWLLLNYEVVAGGYFRVGLGLLGLLRNSLGDGCGLNRL